METLQAIKERRAINFFDPARPLPPDALTELLQLANLSPSSFGLQPWKVVAVTDPERKKTLRRCAMNQQKVEEAPAVLIMIADPNGVEENMDRMLESWQELGYMKPEMRKAYSEMMLGLYGARDSLTRRLFAVKNTALFAMTFMREFSKLKSKLSSLSGNFYRVLSLLCCGVNKYKKNGFKDLY